MKWLFVAENISLARVCSEELGRHVMQDLPSSAIKLFDLVQAKEFVDDGRVFKLQYELPHTGCARGRVIPF